MSGTSDAFAQAAMNVGSRPVILASASPRRREILEGLGIAVDVHPAGIDEIARPGESGPDQAERFAREKASAIAADRAHDDRIVIAADTVVDSIAGVLGKPTSPDDAARMLRALSGRTHVVTTGVAVSRGSRMVSGIEQTEVTFRDLSHDEIAAYTCTDEPYDKAGSYGVQARGRAFVSRISGCSYNVMGLPVVRLRSLLADL